MAEQELEDGAEATTGQLYLLLDVCSGSEIVVQHRDQRWLRSSRMKRCSIGCT